MKEQPNYYSIIPAHVRYDKELKPMEVIMYGELTALSNKYGYSYASNNYFAELYNVHKKTVSTWISNLKEKGYIDTVVIRDENMTVTERRIYITAPYPSNHGEGYPQKSGDPIHKKTEENNTRINNTRINRDSDETSKSFQYISNNLEIIQSPLKAQQLEEAIKDFKDNKLEIVTVATDYCKENSKGVNYLIKVLENWSKDGVDTKEKAISKVKPRNNKEDDYLAKKKQELLGG
ncbi:helix-turn-helix domain-containing protein [Staphylococcus epidermidis]|uniref:DNA replication protein n=1 Tax=Staphylococcus phage vB_SepiS-phiIPLA5 TaxID=2922988 RepID=I6T7K7_9CAUD|nr:MULTISPECIES: helix-turn-helix domain-containing protein [Staphylococcus]YP_006560985.1 replication initiation protein [Staphylococcus phage Ipla5]MDU1505959.1 helix-turn-helix domain-containing protein [Limosilactobacillus vaginalis]MDU3826867.1 helix-turn-helix domain-containing protein [Enterococcus faecalis]MDU3977927.1 helix-turn-helix domain-containing protein [Staphylococcus sp.]MDU4965024.1 helix-turn-helix domain-containing protein [Staphylococcus warneri]MDU6091776.1 helix-turn-h